MAAAALSAFLEVLLKRVASPSVLGFFKDNNLDHRLLRKLKMKLLAVNLVIDDAEVKQITGTTVKDWLQELEDAMYESDDLLDAVNTEAMRCQLEKEIQSSSSTQNMDELSSMEAKLKEILQRLEDIVEEIKHLGLEKGVPEQPNKVLPTTSLLDEVSVYGRDKEKESLVNQLLDENDSGNNVEVITIKGMGGVGKTTLVQLVYNDDDIVQHFDLRAWVCISEDFDVFKVTKTILQAVTSSISGPEDLNLLQEQLKNKLVGKKFLLVLDDVWNENRDRWNLLKKSIESEWMLKGSRILVTTRNEEVAQIMRTVPTHSLEKLSDEHCWELFAKYAFEGGESQAQQDLREMGREIVKKKCGGLPLAAKALGCLLRGKKTTEEWSKIMESNVWDLEDKNCNIMPVLRVSYHFLPPRLKRCFAFASIFPKDYKFKKDELILLWAAQSFFPEGKNVYDIGDEYFNELLSRSFFQRSGSKVFDHFRGKKIDIFVMHDLMHDLATIVSGQSCRCCENPGDIQKITKTTRHMSYYSKDSIEQFQSLPATNTLRTFAQVREYMYRRPKWRQEEISDVLLMRFKLLRVLSLREYNIQVLPETVGSLKHLRHFDLSETKLKRLPNSICDLYNLQTLILTYCSDLIELPTHMCNLLVNLHTLDVTGCENLREMPRNLGKLKNLARLGRFSVGEGNSGGNIRELGPLSNLGGELWISELQNVVSGAVAAEARLKDKKYLEKLELSWDFDEDDPRKDYEVLEKLQPHRSVKELTIRYYGGQRFPNWIADQIYSNMVSLILEDCKHCRSIPALGQLPSLKELYINGFTNPEKLDSEFYGNSYAAKPFGSLEILSFKGMPQWKEWYHRDGEAFPLLREFHLADCPKLRGNLPAHLPSLIKLKIVRCPDLAISLPEAPALSDSEISGCKNFLGCSDGGLPSLRSLRISSCDMEVLLDRGLHGLNSLEILTFEGMPQWKEWYHRDGEAFPLLRELHLEDCPKLRGNLPAHLPSLIELKIDGCPDLAISLPEAHALSNLEISGCKNFLDCSDGGLPTSLRSLQISSCDMEVLLDRGLHGLNSLEILSFQGMLQWKEWYHRDGEAFPLLRELHLEDCPKLRGNLPAHLPSLIELYIDGCPDLSVSLPEAPALSDLEIRGCNKFLGCSDGGLPSLRSLRIASCDMEVLLDRVLHGLNSLEILSFEWMPQWKEWYHRDGEAFPLLRELHLEDCPKFRGNLPAHLPSLIRLYIDGCPDLAVSLPEAPALSDLEISGCKNILGCSDGGLPSLQSFPLQKFPRLVRLQITECPNLESFSSPDGTILELTNLSIRGCNKFLGCSDGALPTSLKSLSIYDCDEFMKVLLDRGGLHGLNSLSRLTIRGKCQGVVSFPAEGILPKSLQWLSIVGFDDLERLEHKGFEHLTSLSELTIVFCRKLKCIPPEGLPASLTLLDIGGCGVLEGRLKRDGGEDWDKIAHIPHVLIGDKKVR